MEIAKGDMEREIEKKGHEEKDEGGAHACLCVSYMWMWNRSEISVL